jgi:hypothetical protein
VVCASETLSLVFNCGTGSCANATLTMTFQNHGTAGPAPVFGACSCSPLHMMFDLSPIPNPGTECNGLAPVNVVVTA